MQLTDQKGNGSPSKPVPSDLLSYARHEDAVALALQLSSTLSSAGLETSPFAFSLTDL